MHYAKYRIAVMLRQSWLLAASPPDFQPSLVIMLVLAH